MSTLLLQALMKSWQQTLAARLGVSQGTISRKAAANRWTAQERDEMLAMLQDHGREVNQAYAAIQAMPVFEGVSEEARTVARFLGLKSAGESAHEQFESRKKAKADEEAEFVRVNFPALYRQGARHLYEREALAAGRPVMEYMASLEAVNAAAHKMGPAWGEKWQALMRARTEKVRQINDVTDLFIANPAHWSKLFPETEK